MQKGTTIDERSKQKTMNGEEDKWNNVEENRILKKNSKCDRREVTVQFSCITVNDV